MPAEDRVGLPPRNNGVAGWAHCFTAGPLCFFLIAACLVTSTAATSIDAEDMVNTCVTWMWTETCAIA